MSEKRPLHLRVVEGPANTGGEGDQIENIVQALMDAVAACMAELGLRGGVDGAIKLRNTVREVVVAGLLRERYSGVIDALTNSTMQAISTVLGQHGYGCLAKAPILRAAVQEQVSGICLETGVHDIEKLRALMATTVPRWVAIVLSRKSQ